MSSWRRGVALVGLAIILVAAGSVPSAFASSSQKQSDINKNISSLRSQLNDVSDEEAELINRLEEINGRKAAVEGQISTLQAAMAEGQRKLDAANAKLAAAESELKRSEAELEAAQKELAANNRELQDHAVNAYIGKDPAAAATKVIMNAEDLTTASTASAYMRQIVSDRRKIVERHRQLEGEARDINRLLDKLREEAVAEQAIVAAQQAELDRQKTELDRLRSRVQAEANAQQALVREAESRRAEFESQIADLQRQSDQIAALLRAAPGPSGPPPPMGNGVLGNPVPGSPMTSPFGTRVHPIFGTTRLHAGQDYGATTGTPIRASAAGTVVTAGFVSGYGNYTCLAHGGGLATCYAHQSAILVGNGQSVGRGDVIGRVGNTGNSTGPHLHFEVRVNGNPVDPRSYL